MIDASELRAVGAEFKSASGRVGAKVAGVVRTSTRAIERAAEANAQVRTGELRAGVVSVTFTGDGRSSAMSGEVTSTSDHGRYVEEGTSVMAPQPYLGPAFDAELPNFVRRVTDAGGQILVSIPANVVARLPLVAAVEARLNDGLPSTNPPTRGYLSEPVDVPVLDTAGHVQRYWVLHPFNGTPVLSEEDLGETNVDLEWSFQITVAAGYARDVIALATLVDDLLFRWAPTVAGYECGPCGPPPGYRAGPPRIDLDVKPHRFYLPLQYRTTVTR